MLRAHEVQSWLEESEGERNRKRMLLSLKVVAFGRIAMGVCVSSRRETVVEEALFHKYLVMLAHELLEPEDDAAALLTPEAEAVELLDEEAMSITQYFPSSSLVHMAS